MQGFKNRRKGFTLIELLIVIAVIAILAAIAIPNLLSSRKSANEASAVGSMRSITSAEATYRTRTGTYGALSDLAGQNLLDYSLSTASTAANAKSGYYFSVTPVSSTQYWVLGQPASAQSGDSVFYTDESGTLFRAYKPSSANTPSNDANGTPPNSAFSQVGQ